MNELIQGDLTLRDALDFQADCLCLDECPEPNHDDTCRILLTAVLLHHLPPALLDRNIQELWRETPDEEGNLPT